MISKKLDNISDNKIFHLPIVDASARELRSRSGISGMRVRLGLEMGRCRSAAFKGVGSVGFK